MSRLDPPRVSRRSWLSLASMGTFFAALGTALAGILRLPNPAVLPGPARRFKLGSPDEFPVGSDTVFADQGLVLFRDNEGFYAVSAICTHLGCTVGRSKDGFACPCFAGKHGEAGLKFQLEAVYDDEITDVEGQEHNCRVMGDAKWVMRKSLMIKVRNTKTRKTTRRQT